MGRLVVVVIVIAAIAFLAKKYLFDGGDPRPAKPGVEASADGANNDGANNDGENGDGENGDAGQNGAGQNDPEGDASADDPAGDESSSPDILVAAAPPLPPAADNPPALADPVTGESESVLLGADEIYDGIPGEGDLTVEQVEEWLADPQNHVVLDPELPLGLAAGAAEIKGLEENPLTRAKIELGRQLFFDPRLSVDNTISCASCHHPDFGYGKNTQFGEGVDGQKGNRNSPVAYNRILSGPQFWDGRAPNLEEQAKGPIANPIEMGHAHDAVVTDLKTVPAYAMQFESVFGDGEGDDAVEIENAAKAIAAFERTLVTGPAPWDHHKELENFEQIFAADIEDLEALQEEDEELYNEYSALQDAADANPLTDSARRGGELFFGEKAGCTQCHLGANFTDEKYHNLGVGMDVDAPDLGRFAESDDEKEKGAFKTPTVRSISTSGPYMHDGSQKTLEEVVEWYDKGGHPNEWLSDKIKPLKLTDQEKQDLVAFMNEGLQSELPKVEQGRLPK